MKANILSVFILSVVLFGTTSAFAQVLYSNGATMKVTNGGILHVNGSAEVNGAAATLDNQGTITTANSVVNGDFTINNNSTVSGSGKYYVQGDWTNNATFKTDSSYVNLSGGNQLITGSVMTTFWDLEISGTGIKTQTLDAEVSNSLELNNLELATDANTMYVTTTDANAVTNDNTFGSEGFVSSLGNGALSRVTDTRSKYFFPTGSSVGTVRYRPVYLTPTAANFSRYEVRLANNDGSADGYPTTQLIADLPTATANKLFYHRIRKDSTSQDAAIEVWYDAATDGNFTSLGQWNTPQSDNWNEIASAGNQKGSKYNSMIVPDWTDWTEDPYVLIEAEGIKVPNVFTPNGDGENDFLVIPGGGIMEYELVIYNRWGQSVFTTTAREISWDGRTTAGVECSEGTYYYTLTAISNSGNDYSQTGYVTLFR